MSKLFVNRILLSFALTVFFFGSFHIMLLVIYAVLTRQWSVLNAFSILDLDKVFPGIESGAWSFAASYSVVLAVFAGVWLLLAKNRKQRRQQMEKR